MLMSTISFCSVCCTLTYWTVVLVTTSEARFFYGWLWYETKIVSGQLYLPIFCRRQTTRKTWKLELISFLAYMWYQKGLSFLLCLCMWMESMLKLGWGIIFLRSIWKTFFFRGESKLVHNFQPPNNAACSENLDCSDTYIFFFTSFFQWNTQVFFFYWLPPNFSSLLISISCGMKCFTSQCFIFPFRTTV